MRFVAAEMVAAVDMGRASVTAATSELFWDVSENTYCSSPPNPERKQWLSLKVQDWPLCKRMSWVHWDKTARPKGCEVINLTWLQFNTSKRIPGGMIEGTPGVTDAITGGLKMGNCCQLIAGVECGMWMGTVMPLNGCCFTGMIGETCGTTDVTWEMIVGTIGSGWFALGWY